MSQGSRAFLGLLILAGSASAATLGPVKGRPVSGQPLEVNIPFALDEPRDRACASANVRYGNALVPRTTLHVQGHGLKRNLLVTSRVNVSGPAVTVDARVGCGARAVTRSFVLATSMPGAKGPRVGEPIARHVAIERPAKPRQRAVVLAPPAEPLFPPPDLEPAPQDHAAPGVDAALKDAVHKAQAEAAAAVAQLESTRRELAAVLDVERRTSQTLIDADRQVRDAQAEAAHMRLVLKWIGAGMALVAAGLAWLEFQRATFRRRRPESRPVQEPTMLSAMEEPA